MACSEFYEQVRPGKTSLLAIQAYQTCHRRFQRGARAGGMEGILQALARDLKERGKLDLRESFTDGTLFVAKKGGKGWERRSGAKVPNSWQGRTVRVFLSP